MNIKAKDLQAGHVFWSDDNPQRLTVTENRGEHFMYRWIIMTEERGNLTMPADTELMVDRKI